MAAKISHLGRVLDGEPWGEEGSPVTTDVFKEVGFSLKRLGDLEVVLTDEN